MCKPKMQQIAAPVAATPAPPPAVLQSAQGPSVAEAQRKRGSKNPLRIDLSGKAHSGGSANGLNVV